MKTIITLALISFFGAIAGAQDNTAAAPSKPAAAVTAQPAPADKKAEVNPYGQAFAGSGVTVEMALFTAENPEHLHDVLLKITGGPAYQEGIDGKIMKYAAVHGGTGVDFQYGDGTHTRMLSREAWGSWTFFEVYLDGKTFKVYPDENLAKKIKPLKFLATYKKEAKKNKK